MAFVSRIPRRTLLAAGLAPLAAAFGCGTILYPERRGQPAGRLDWGIVALDAIGLLLFFVPGVIAFAVDFSNGTIYLPDDYDYYGSLEAETPETTTLRTCKLPSEHPSLTEVEAALQQELHVTVSLQDETVRSKPLNSLQEFWREARSLRGAA